MLLEKLGKVLAGIFAFGCGITVCGVFVMLRLTGVDALIYGIVSVLFLATSCTNYRMCRHAVPEVLVDIFGKDRLFQGLLETQDGLSLSKFKHFLVKVGILLAFSVGITFGTLNFFSSVALMTKFSSSAIFNFSVFPFMLFLAVVVFIVMTSLMLKSIALIIKNENLLFACINTISNLINTDPNLPCNQNKSRKRIILERSITLFLLVIFLPLSVLGLVMTMETCAISLNNILLQIPHAMPSVVYRISKTIALGFAFLGQLPFVIRTSVLSASEIFSEKQCSVALAQKNTLLNKLFRGVFLVLRIITALGNGILALMGAQGSTTASLAVAGGVINNFAAAANDPPQSKSNKEVSKAQNLLSEKVNYKKSKIECGPISYSPYYTSLYSSYKATTSG